MADLIFEFLNNGKPCGFHACKEKEFIFKPNKWSAAIFPLDKLKNNLRLMVKTKRAKIIKAGTKEAVVVPEMEFNNLFL